MRLLIAVLHRGDLKKVYQVLRKYASVSRGRPQESRYRSMAIVVHTCTGKQISIISVATFVP